MNVITITTCFNVSNVISLANSALDVRNGGEACLRRPASDGGKKEEEEGERNGLLASQPGSSLNAWTMGGRQRRKGNEHCNIFR